MFTFTDDGEVGAKSCDEKTVEVVRQTRGLTFKKNYIDLNWLYLETSQIWNYQLIISLEKEQN